jgi:hypothetical protein
VGVDSKTEDVRPTTSRTTTTTSSKTSISGPEQKKDIQIHKVVGTSESPSNKETTTINIQNDRIDNKTEIKIGRGFGKNISIADRTESRKTTTATTTTVTVTKSSEKTTSILGKIEGARDISKIFYDLVSLNIISLATTLLPKYGLAFRAYKKIKNKIKSMVCHRDVYEL